MSGNPAYLIAIYLLESTQPKYRRTEHGLPARAPARPRLQCRTAPNHLPWAIATTILCCLPAGIVSIVFAAQVNSKWMSGDQAGAYKASNNAKTWAIVSAVLGVIVGVIYFIIAMASSSST